MPRLLPDERGHGEAARRQENRAGPAVRPRSPTSRPPGASPGRARSPRHERAGQDP
nr:MAG TPA: hypothetical protein [Caudoviricetes sp.]